MDNDVKTLTNRIKQLESKLEEYKDYKQMYRDVWNKLTLLTEFNYHIKDDVCENRYDYLNTLIRSFDIEKDINYEFMVNVNMNELKNKVSKLYIKYKKMDKIEPLKSFSDFI